MSAQAFEKSPMLLSAAMMTPGHRRAALAVCLLALLTCLSTLPFAQIVWWTFPGFLLIQQTLQAGNCLIIAALLYGHYSIARTNELAVLASGYLVTALLVLVHTLSFPGTVSETGLLTGGPQSTPWLYIGWHAALPLAVMAYASGRWHAGAGLKTARTQIVISILGAIAIAVGITACLIVGHGSLPRLVEGGRLTPASRVAVATLLLLQLAALILLVNKKPRSVLDIWLMVTMFVSICTVSLVSLISAQRFDAGWYIGRVYDVTTSTFILLLLLSEIVTLYRRSALAAAIEHRERERRLNEMEAVLIHLSRVNGLGRDVSALIHEVGQPFAVISMLAKMMKRSDSADQVRQLLEPLLESVENAAAIIRRSRDFIKNHQPERRTQEIAPVIDSAIELVSFTNNPGSAVPTHFQYGQDATSAFFDRVQIQQVVFNLVRNAMEAMAGSPRQVLTIATACTTEGMIEVSVADTGSGLPPAVRAKLFAPFVTTKESGLGVGLSICRVIIEAHGGELQANDNPGGGTIFSFTVPPASATANEPVLQGMHHGFTN